MINLLLKCCLIICFQLFAVFLWALFKRWPLQKNPLHGIFICVARINPCKNKCLPSTHSHIILKQPQYSQEHPHRASGKQPVECGEHKLCSWADKSLKMLLCHFVAFIFVFHKVPLTWSFPGSQNSHKNFGTQSCPQQHNFHEVINFKINRNLICKGTLTCYQHPFEGKTL